MSPTMNWIVSQIQSAIASKISSTVFNNDQLNSITTSLSSYQTGASAYNLFAAQAQMAELTSNFLSYANQKLQNREAYKELESAILMKSTNAIESSTMKTLVSGLNQKVVNSVAILSQTNSPLDNIMRDMSCGNVININSGTIDQVSDCGLSNYLSLSFRKLY